MSVLLKGADWHLYTRGADATLVSLNQANPGSDTRLHVSNIACSFDDTDHKELELYGMSKVGPFDATDTGVVNLTNDTFTVAGHGLSNGNKVVYDNGGGTSIGSITSGTAYWVVGVAGSVFQLSATLGGAAINLTGTQANFGTAQLVIPQSKGWMVYDQVALTYMYPLPMAYGCPAYLQVTPGAGIQALVHMEGFSGGR